jgi:YidC/Oxa1 family membrane protein insertase
LDSLGHLWNTVVVVLTQGLAFFYFTIETWGIHGGTGWALAIIAFTILIKVVTLPLTWQQLKSSKAMQELQPRLKLIQKQYAKDKEAQVQAQMALYKEHGVNPALGCLPMLVQMPVWFALYQAMFSLGQETSPYFESFSQPFLWIANLAQPEALLQWPPHGWPILIFITGASQWVLQKMMTPNSDDPQQKMMSSMMQFMPLMFVFFSFQVPAGLVVYWVTSNIFSLVQQYFITGWGSLRTSAQAVSSGGEQSGGDNRANENATAGQNESGHRDAMTENEDEGGRGRRKRGKKRR